MMDSEEREQEKKELMEDSIRLLEINDSDSLENREKLEEYSIYDDRYCDSNFNLHGANAILHYLDDEKCLDKKSCDTFLGRLSMSPITLVRVFSHMAEQSLLSSGNIRMMREHPNPADVVCELDSLTQLFTSDHFKILKEREKHWWAIELLVDRCANWGIIPYTIDTIFTLEDPAETLKLGSKGILPALLPGVKALVEENFDFIRGNDLLLPSLACLSNMNLLTREKIEALEQHGNIEGLTSLFTLLHQHKILFSEDIDGCIEKTKSGALFRDVLELFYQTGLLDKREWQQELNKSECILSTSIDQLKPSGDTYVGQLLIITGGWNLSIERKKALNETIVCRFHPKKHALFTAARVSLFRHCVQGNPNGDDFNSYVDALPLPSEEKCQVKSQFRF